jgi:hypothetical protein
MEVIDMRIAMRGLMKDPRGARDSLRRRLMERGISQEPSLELVGTEQPFHPGVLIHHQAANEVPVARLVEAKNTSVKHRQAEAVELKPSFPVGRQASGIPGKEEEVGITPGPMRTVPGMCAAEWARQISDTERVPPGKSVGHITSRALDRVDQGGGSVSAALPWA